LGAWKLNVLLELPQMPGPVAVLVAAQFEEVLPFVHVQTHWPLPVSVTVLAEPPEHKFVAGADDEDEPLAEPQILEGGGCDDWVTGAVHVAQDVGS
jgi:hypothetical protein